MAFFRRNETPAPAPTPAPATAPAAELTGEARKQMHLNKIVEHLDSNNLKYSTERGFVELYMTIDGKLGRCRFALVPGENEIQCFAFCPIKAKPEAYANVVEFITRANYSLPLGNFEFDYRDGGVRFHTYLLSRDGTPSEREIGTIFAMAVRIMDMYGNGLVKNLMGFGDPEKDIAEIENN